MGQRIAFAAVNDPPVAAVVSAYVTDIVGLDRPSLQHDDAAIVAAWNQRWGRAGARLLPQSAKR
jgi:hypothetical protein